MSTIPTRKSAVGFTLLELLVVVGIIAILAAILVTVFARVRENGRSAVCQSNQRQILLAMLQYTHDEDGRLPMGWRDNTPPRKVVFWHQVLAAYAKSQQIFLCPDDPGNQVLPPSTVLSPLPTFHTSYAANAWIVVPLTGHPSLLLSQVAKPETTVFLTDGGAQASPFSVVPAITASAAFKDGCLILNDQLVDSTRQPEPGNPYDGNAYECGPHLRHSGWSNVGFVDGHVKPMPAERWYGETSPWLNPSKGGS